MKHALLVGGLLIGLSNVAVAQGSDVHSRIGDNGSTFLLDSKTAVFHYEATVSGCSVAHVTTLEVSHNGILKLAIPLVMLAPPHSYLVCHPIDMSAWGLKAGDSVTFKLKVVKIGLLEPLLASHTLIGKVVSEAPRPVEAPVSQP